MLKKLHKKLLYDTFGTSQNDNLLKNLLTMLPDDNAKILDLGCGNGTISNLILKAKPNLKITGAEVKVRDDCLINCIEYEGKNLPFEDDSFEYVMMINMLHHTPSPKITLKEAARVSRKGVIIKDHYANNKFDFANLIFMEWIGNMFTKINQPYKFLSQKQWHKLFLELGLETEIEHTKMRIYTPFLDIFFGRNLHFLGKYKKNVKV